ncbi:MAG: hypothetical protein ACM3O8_03095 [Methylococcaceae bacterium]|nr:hypothetical protein [Prolixibacteraceae bacterium]
MKKSIVLTLLLLGTLSTYADIRPNPIKAKGIIAGKNTSIRMDSEMVVVDLYKDSAVVECHFYMKNDSDSQKLTIGFPEMNFQYFRSNDGTETGNFCAFENGERVKLINFHQAASLKEKFPFTGLTNQQGDDQPWFLWDSEFDNGEKKTIVVRYTLPYGATKAGCRYFTYLLNTGSGWKGNIGKAEITVNLKDITPDLILKAMPGNYKTNGKQLSWIFTDFEPTIKDDINIYYEESKGYYSQNSQKIKDNAPMIVVDDKVLPKIDPLELETMGMERFAELLNVKVEEIQSIEIRKDKETISKYNTANGVLIVYTKDYLKNKPKDN